MPCTIAARPLAVARFHVCETVPFLGERSHGLGQQLGLGSQDRQLASTGPNQLTRDLQVIAYVQMLEDLRRGVGQLWMPHHDL